MFSDYFRFPFLVFVTSPDLYLIAAGLSLLVAILGAIHALRDVVKLAPAVAMQPPAPPRFKKLVSGAYGIDRFVSQPIVMMLRNLVHHPIRAIFTVIGILGLRVPVLRGTELASTIGEYLREFELRNSIGVQFDPTVVRAFLDVSDELPVA